jgi:hypothetical protein
MSGTAPGLCFFASLSVATEFKDQAHSMDIQYASTDQRLFVLAQMKHQ